MPTITTSIVVLSEESVHSPSQLLAWAQSTGEPLELKETCYGIIVQGEQSAVNRALGEIRKRAPYETFCKERGYCIGDKSKCRIGKKGGWSGSSRAGFHQLEKESRMLTMIGKAVAIADAGEEIDDLRKRRNRTDENKLRLIVKEALSME